MAARADDVDVGIDERRMSMAGAARTGCIKSDGGSQAVRVTLTVLGIAAVACAIGLVIALSPTASPTERTLKVPERASVSFTTEFKNDNEYWSTGEYKGEFFKELEADGSWNVHGYYYYDRDGVRTTMTYYGNAVSYKQTNVEGGEVLRAGCLAPDGVMPLMSQLKNAIELAEPVAAEKVVGVDISSQCNGGDAYVVRLDGDDFVVCDVGDGDGDIEAVFGEDFETVITNFRVGDAAAPVVTDAPVDMAGNALECEPIAADHDSRRALRASPYADLIAAEGPWWAQTPEDHQRRRLTGSNVCVFMLGPGYKTDQSVSTTSFTEYWGDVHTHALTGSHCGSVKFIRRDTTNRAWDDLTLQEHFCDVAAGGHNGALISNTWVFSHSFGSLVVAGAIQSGLCSFASTSKWHQVAGPWNGLFANYQNGCDSFPNGDSAWEDLNNQLGFCLGTGVHRTETAAWASMRPGYVGPRQSYASITNSLLHANVKGGMCGHDAWGVSGNACLQDLQDSVLQVSNTDGTNPVGDCKRGAASSSTNWGSSSTDNYYNAHINILDATCRNGNAAYGSDKKPCWFYRFAG